MSRYGTTLSTLSTLSTAVSNRREGACEKEEKKRSGIWKFSCLSPRFRRHRIICMSSSTKRGVHVFITTGSQRIGITDRPLMRRYIHPRSTVHRILSLGQALEPLKVRTALILQ